MGDKAKTSKLKQDGHRHLGKVDAQALHDRAATLRGRDRVTADPHAVSRRLRPERGTT